MSSSNPSSDDAPAPGGPPDSAPRPPAVPQLGPATLARYAGRILNIHPGPLPAFGGHGMYGRRVHEAVIAAGAPESGVTIHLVDAEYDRGPVIARRSVPVLAGDTAESLEARVTSLEPEFYVQTLKDIVSGAVKLPERIF